jgi:hypothetical protein
MRGREPLQIFTGLLALDQFETCSHSSPQSEQKSIQPQHCTRVFKDFLARLQGSGYSGVLIDRALLPTPAEPAHRGWTHLVQMIQSHPQHRSGGPKITPDLPRYLYLSIGTPVTSSSPQSSREPSNPEIQKQETQK